MLTKDEAEASGAGNGGNTAPRLDAQERDGQLMLALSGDWTTRTVSTVDAELRRLAEERRGGVHVDLSRLGRIDTAGAWLIERFVAKLSAEGGHVTVEGADASAQVLLSAVGRAAGEVMQVSPRRRWDPLGIVVGLGKTMYAARDDFLMAMHMLGATIRGAQMKEGRGHAVNVASIATHIDRMGIGAIPVVVLMSAIVGAIVAQQGAFQLRYFGAEIFVVDLVGILVWRELGVLLTAIMIAGRSGSAITAEIGSMKMREEVDALTVIGLNPVGVLVFPRLIALMVALPCLTVAANFAAIGGAMLTTWFYSGISPQAFVDRMRDTIDLSTIFAGLIKAPFMAIIIGIVGSVEGMQVGGSAESLGKQVTKSVVKAIFIVIVVDGLFAMFYAAIDF
ncbi:MAG: ABC transporter permease [Rhizobiaceae bacterium]|nr:ABC transporter permease [Rhizobiaceae bacterium]MCV0408208.1 ABC transporter permease [Rhizobiaceae bacterium]